MKFSDTTNKNGLVQECEFITGLGDTSISGDSGLLNLFTRLLNQRNFLINSIILECHDEWGVDDLNNTDFPEKDTDLVDGQRDYSFFDISPKILQIKRLDITYDGETYIKATPIQEGEMDFGLGDDSDIDDQFSKTSPRYSLNGRSILIYPRANATDVTNGAEMKLRFTRHFNEFESSDTTTEPGIDRLWHKMIAVGASMDYGIAKSLDNTNNLASVWNDYENRIRTYYGSKQKDRDYILDTKLTFKDYK